MFSSKSKLLGQKSVQDAADTSEVVKKAALLFDSLHREIDENPGAPTEKKIERARAKQNLRRTLHDAGVQFSE